MQPRVPTVRAKKSTTRMRKKAPAATSTAAADRSKSAGGGSALQLLQDHPADTSVDSFIEIQELVTSRHEDDQNAFDKSILNSPHLKKAEARGGLEEVSLDLSAALDDEERETVTQEELRAVFEQSLNVDDEFLAEKG